MPCSSVTAHDVDILSRHPTDYAQAQFLRRARRSDALRRRHREHLWTSAAGGCLFALEEVAPRIPLIHTGW